MRNSRRPWEIAGAATPATLAAPAARKKFLRFMIVSPQDRSDEMFDVSVDGF
jgi:hypothetical protein